MRMPHWLTRTAVILGAVVLLLFLTVCFIPSRELLEVVQRAMAQQGLTLAAERVGKAVPLGLTATNVVVSAERGALFAAERLTCRVHLLPLLAGRLVWSAEARVGSGTVTIAGTLGKNPILRLNSRDLRLERIPLIKTALGGTVQGALAINGSLAGNWPAVKGALRLDVAALELREVSLGGVRLPDALYRSMRGQLDLAGGTVTLQSLALDGDSVYGRLKGTFPLTAPPTAAPLNLTFELMTKPEFMEKQKLIFLLLTRFMVSPGNFQIPVKGSLGSPAVL